MILDELQTPIERVSLSLNLLVAISKLNLLVVTKLLPIMHITKWPKWHTSGTVRM